MTQDTAKELSAAEELADAMLRAAGSALRYYEPHMRTRIIGIAAKAIGDAEELRGRSEALGEWAERLQDICEKHGALGGDNRIDFIERALDSQAARIADLRMQLRSCECPRPVLADRTIGACVDGGQCGCIHRDAASGAADFWTLQGEWRSANALLEECERVLSNVLAVRDKPAFDAARTALTKLRERSK